jgi:hypothetical protein
LGFLDLLKARDYLKLHFKGYQFEIFHRPGEWMDQDRLVEIQERVVAITLESCGKHPQAGFYVDTGLMKDKTITICSRQGEDCAFGVLVNIGKYENRYIVHLGPYYSAKKNRGLMTLTFLFGGHHFLFRHRTMSVYFTTITHVPRVFGILVQCFSHVYPNQIPDESPSLAHLQIRDRLVNSYIKEIAPEYAYKPEDGFILKAFRLQKDGSIIPYPHTAETIPKHRSALYNDRCLAMIDYERGDAMIQVGEAGVRNYFTGFGRNFIRALRKGHEQTRQLISRGGGTRNELTSFID